MTLKGYRAGQPVKAAHVDNKKAAREQALQWPECDAFRYGSKYYTPAQVYAGMERSSSAALLGLA